MRASIQHEIRYNTHVLELSCWTGCGRMSVQGYAADFMRLCVAMGVRTIEIFASDNPLDKTYPMSVRAAMDIYDEMVLTLAADHPGKRGRKVAYTFEVTCPYTLAILFKKTVYV